MMTIKQCFLSQHFQTGRVFFSRLCLLVCCLSLSGYASANQSVLTSLPVTYLLTSQLLQGTNLSVAYLPSPRFSLNRHLSWFESHQQEVAQKAESALAVVTIASIWPQDPLYPQVRQFNVRIVPIDAAQAISPRAQAVASLRNKEGTLSPYVWLNPVNLTTMLNIISQDLQQIFPQHAQRIADNQSQSAAAITALMLANQQFLFDQEIESVVLLDPALLDFAAGYSLYVHGHLFKPELEWNEQDKKQLKQWIEQDPSAWIVATRAQSKQLKQILPQFSRYLLVDPIQRFDRGFELSSPWQRWRFTLAN
jgi:hypothetical protein